LKNSVAWCFNAASHTHQPDKTESKHFGGHWFCDQDVKHRPCQSQLGRQFGIWMELIILMQAQRVVATGSDGLQVLRSYERTYQLASTDQSAIVPTLSDMESYVQLLSSVSTNEDFVEVMAELIMEADKYASLAGLTHLPCRLNNRQTPSIPTSRRTSLSCPTVSGD
jgi:hypothetical protein